MPVKKKEITIREEDEGKKKKEDKKEKIIFGAKNLKKGERRCTMMEAYNSKQIRYFGVKKVDKVIIDMINGKQRKKPEMTDSEIIGHTNGKIQRVKNLTKYIEKEKRMDKPDEKKIQQMTKERQKIIDEVKKGDLVKKCNEAIDRLNKKEQGR
jgi:hypothetical protein